LFDNALGNLLEIADGKDTTFFPNTIARSVNFRYFCDMIIEAKGIEKSFGTLKVLKGVDFQAERGEVVAIMGASGAGKSTLLQILGTLSTPDAGSLTVDGTDVRHLGQRELSAFRNRRIGFVFQAHHLLPEFDALENVTIPALIGGVSMREAREKARRLLGEVGLSERLTHKPSELSGGEQQRVAIARALVNDPAILFADEPSGNLDSRTKEEIHRLFFDLRDRLGQTVVIVTHDPSLAALCDRTLVMRDGQFVGGM
jgi:lipoprotein-releasing system ATP-binding protein